MRSPRVRVVLTPLLPVATTTSLAFRPSLRGRRSLITWRRDENPVRLVASFSEALLARPFSRSTWRRQPLGQVPRTSSCDWWRLCLTRRIRRGPFLGGCGPVLGGSALIGVCGTGWWQIVSGLLGAALDSIVCTAFR